MRINRVIISLVGVVTVLTLAWHTRINADTGAGTQPAVLERAERALQKQQPERALALLSDQAETALRADVRSDAWGLICRAYFQQGDYESAELACTAALEEGDSLLAWSHLNNRGVMRMAQRRFDAAIEDFHAAMRINPRASSVRRNLAMAERLKRS
ncbi:MAG: hypothetical protein Hals2KO_19370 [Halioglobus sp.]